MFILINVVSVVRKMYVARFKVLTAMSVEKTLFWDVARVVWHSSP
jgi:hypothetical protein